MSFNKTQLVLILSVLAIVFFLFFKGYKTAKGSMDSDSSTFDVAFNMQSYIEDEKKELPQATLLQVTEFEKDTKSKQGLQNLTVLWDSLNNQFISAYYMEQYASIESTEKNWMAAGSKYYTFASMANDSLMIAEGGTKAKKAFEKVLTINPNNLNAKTALAAIIVQIDQDVMKGVGMLKEVVAADSNNVQAIFTLGMLSIQSGQFDKAEERFLKLVQLQPFNPEYYFYLGEVYAKGGNTQKAIKTYETCKTLLKDEAAKKEIETLIQKLNNI